MRQDPLAHETDPAVTRRSPVPGTSGQVPVRRGRLAVALVALLAAAAVVAPQADRLGPALVRALTLPAAVAAPAATEPALTPEQEQARARSRAAAAAASVQLDRTALLLDTGDADGALETFSAAVAALAGVRPEEGRAALDARAQPLRDRLVAAVRPG